MRIISNFHDYYDCIQRLGQDQSVIYLRERKIVNDWPFPKCYGKWNRNDGDTRIRVVGFCGQVYPLIEFRYSNAWSRCWNIDEVDDFIDQRLKKRELDSYYCNKWGSGYIFGRHRKHFQKFFMSFTKNYEYLFRDHHAPLFVATRKRESTIVFNDCLKNVDFVRKFDPYQAFQEIAMYLGGVLGSHGGRKTKYKGKPMSSEVSDCDLLVAKGFDKNSFRNVR